jgi:hypothetical protein
MRSLSLSILLLASAARPVLILLFLTYAASVLTLALGSFGQLGQKPSGELTSIQQPLSARQYSELFAIIQLAMKICVRSRVSLSFSYKHTSC